MKTKYYSYLLGRLSKGCSLCIQGKKLVFLVSGLCSRRCYFCPLSEQKKFKDVIYADEWLIKKDDEILEEIRLCSSKGAGITGGDPFIVFNRTLKYIKLFKRKFGKMFHIHLYAPTELITKEKMTKLYKAGLDEIRIHPSFLVNGSKDDWDKIELAREFDWKVTVEIPLIPRREREIKDLILFLEKIKVDYLNLNEFEMSETNSDELLKKGFHCKDSYSYGIRGSEKSALRLLNWMKRNKIKLNVHYCTAKLKNSVQLLNRIKRRAKNTAKKYDFITETGTLFRGAIYSKKKDLNKIKNDLMKEFNIPNNLIEIDKGKKRILTAVYIVDELKKELKKKGLIPAIVEEIPTHDRLELMRDYL